MLAVVYDELSDQLSIKVDHPRPVPGQGEALIRVLRAGVCSTDLHIIKGYVPGFNNVLGHEFAGMIEECAAKPELIGTRVVGEINLNIGKFCCSDAVYQRNHAPGRTVLGIIGKDGVFAEYVTLPIENLHQVPASLTDLEATYTEPLAAACRILEQGLPTHGSSTAVIGDGKLGLLVAQVLVAHGAGPVTLIGRHPHKMSLVQGLTAHMVLEEDTLTKYAAAFDMCVEATGSASGISAALAILRPLGTLVLKSTVSLKDPNSPLFSQIANDIVVNEKTLLGSRCGPFDVALKMLASNQSLKDLVNAMTSKVFPAKEGLEAIHYAQQKGVLKVQLLFGA